MIFIRFKQSLYWLEASTEDPGEFRGALCPGCQTPFTPAEWQLGSRGPPDPLYRSCLQCAMAEDSFRRIHGREPGPQAAMQFYLGNDYPPLTTVSPQALQMVNADTAIQAVPPLDEGEKSAFNAAETARDFLRTDEEQNEAPIPEENAAAQDVNPSRSSSSWKCSHLFCKLYDQPLRTEEVLRKHLLTKHTPRRCFVDDCSYSALPNDLRDHLRTAHGVNHMRAQWLSDTPEQWEERHPYKCPVLDCELSWRGCRRVTALQKHIREGHWVGPQDRLPSGRYKCGVCSGYATEFANKYGLALHLRDQHAFGYILPFNPMDDNDQEEEGEASSDRLDAMGENGDKEASSSPASVYQSHDEPTREADNVGDWVDPDIEIPDWAV